MGHKGGIRKVKNARSEHGAPAARLARGKAESSAEVRALVRSHAHLCVALRAAGRWILRRASTKRDFATLEKLRDALRKAENVSEIGGHLTKRGGDVRQAAAGKRSNSNPAAQIIVLPKKTVVAKRAETRHAL